jgi:hypothetical protein
MAKDYKIIAKLTKVGSDESIVEEFYKNPADKQLVSSSLVICNPLDVTAVFSIFTGDVLSPSPLYSKILLDPHNSKTYVIGITLGESEALLVSGTEGIVFTLFGSLLTV